MKRALLALVLVAVATAGAGATTAAHSPAQQAEPNATATGTPTATPTATPTPTATATATATSTPADPDRPNETLIQVDQYLSVTDYEYDGDRMHVDLYATFPTQVAISDVLGPVQDAGAHSVPRKTVLVDGETTVTMDVGEYRGSAAVSVGTSDGAVYLSTGIRPVNPFAGGSATVGWFGGAGLAMGMFIGAAVYVKRTEGGAPEVAGDA